MNRAFTLVEILIVLVVVAIIAAFLWPVFERMRGSRNRSVCISNLKQIGLGFMQYTRDYDEKWPPARVTSSTGWVDVLQPYIKSRQIFQCPSVSGAKPQFSSDYFYNRRLARTLYSSARNPARIILTGDGAPVGPTWSSLTQLPIDSRTNVNSPAQRHIEGANYCFMDGHAKFYKVHDLGMVAWWRPD